MWVEFLIKLGFSAVLWLVIEIGAALCHYPIAWWLAALMALGFVFLGELLIDLDGD